MKSSPDDNRLDHLHRVHAGPLFDIFRATLGGRDVAVKRHAVMVRDGALASAWTESDVTNIFHHRQLGWPECQPPPDATYFDALLRAEHVVIENAAVHWNHPGARLARWLASDELSDAEGDAGVLCLVMPWCSGDSFALLPRADRRRLFPAMLPPLWRALTACPHGDLTPADLMIERAHGFFRILDPGVRITGPVYPGRLEFTSDLFTTNVAHYSLVLPEHGPGQARVRAPAGGLAHIVESYAGTLFDQWRWQHPAKPPVVPGPAAADVVACGAIYFGVLAGASLISLLGIDAPLWAGMWSDWGDRPEPHRQCLDALTGGVLSRALHAAGATNAEIALCERLVMLDLDVETLERYVADVTRTI